MSEPDHQHEPGAASPMRQWVFRVAVADRAGALTSIASAFSNRGISLETIVGHGTPYPGAPGGTVVATFWCSEADKDAIVRVVRRLAKVTHLEERPYASTLLRKSALVRVSRRLRPADVAGEECFVTCEPVAQDADACTYFLAGPPGEVDLVIARLVHAGILLHMVYSLIAH